MTGIVEKRAACIAYDMCDNLMFWLVDATDPSAIRCCVRECNSDDEARCQEHQTFESLKGGIPTETIAVRLQEQYSHVDRATLNSPGAAVTYLSMRDPALKTNANDLLSLLGLL